MKKLHWTKNEDGSWYAADPYVDFHVDNTYKGIRLMTVQRNGVRSILGYFQSVPAAKSAAARYDHEDIKPNPLQGFLVPGLVAGGLAWAFWPKGKKGK